MNSNDLLRLARCEAICDDLRAQMEDVLQDAYKKACEDRDEETAAELARRIRDKLLSESDKEMALDRRLPPAPTGITFTAWLDWLRALADVAKNNWATYRQALRDLPEQEGFPFDVEFPAKPEASERMEQEG